jgi:general stress protein YciG
MSTSNNGNQGGKEGGKRGGRGFAGMDGEKQREIASKGGHAAHEKGTAHEFDSEEAREAGRKGGEAVSQNREHMAEIGRKGGEASAPRAAEPGPRSPQDGPPCSRRPVLREDAEDAAASGHSPRRRSALHLPIRHCAE